MKLDEAKKMFQGEWIAFKISKESENPEGVKEGDMQDKSHAVITFDTVDANLSAPTLGV